MPKSRYTSIHVHLGRYLYMCELEGCGYRTLSTTGIRLHMWSRHGRNVGNTETDTTLVCFECSEEFRDLHAIGEHYKRSGHRILPP